MVLLLIAPYGRAEVALFGGFWTLLAAGMALWHPAAAALPALGLAATVSFFRDPDRKVPPGEDTMVAPADGRVADIEEIREEELLGESAVRLGIFLSVFDVHVNRTPCAGVVRSTRYTPGAFRDARDPECPRRNERNDIVIERSSGGGRVLVRQIAGALARRIVCAVNEQESVLKGQRLGMIKFGSRTELYIPARFLAEVTVSVGDRVRGGETIVARTR